MISTANPSQIHHFIILIFGMPAFVHIRDQMLDVSLDIIELFSPNPIRIVEVVPNVDEEVRHYLILYEPVVVFEDVDVAEPYHVRLEVFVSEFFVFFEDVFAGFAEG